MTSAVIAALIAAGASLVLAVWNFAAGLTSQRRIEQLKSDLAESRAGRDARRDYEYEARKRLYQQLEPIRFQFAGVADSAYARIADLARAARQGHLGSPDNWLDGNGDAYFLLSTVYRLLAPMAVLRLAQGALTLVDLALDPEIKYWYIVARKIASTFSDDINLSQAYPPLDYRPNDQVRRRLKVSPLHRRQGIYIGRVEAAADSLLTEDHGALRLMTFGEYEGAWRTGAEPLCSDLRPFFQMLTNFHPRRSPVTWRILVAQAHLYRVILGVKRLAPRGDPEWRLVLPLPEAERVKLEWYDRDVGTSTAGTQPLDDASLAVIEPLAVVLDWSIALYRDS